MKQKKQSKEFVKGISGSLALRVLLIETVLLVIPLLCFAGIMYYEDSRIKSKENRFSLALIAEEKTAQIEQLIEGSRQFLNAFDQFNPSQNELDRLPALLIMRLNQELICDRSTDVTLLGKNFSYLKFDKSFAYSSNTKQFYISEKFLNERSIWIRLVSSEDMRHLLTLQKENASFVTLSILTDERNVLISSEEEWAKEKIEKSSPFLVDGKQFVGKETSIPGSSFSLLVSAPYHMHFVDIPYFLAKMTGFLALILIIGGGATCYLTFRMGKPLKRLQRSMKRVSESDLNVCYKKDRMGFEINAIGESFNEMVASLNETIEEIRSTQAAKKAIEQELIIGQKVQTSLLPKTLPSFPGLDIAARFISAKEVGGDFYDFLVRKGKKQSRLFFSIADTAGKGVSACLYSLSVRSMLRSFSEVQDDLATILKETNNLFCMDTGDTGVFVTAWTAFFDPETKDLQYSSCGHFPAYLLRLDGTLKKLNTKGMALGVTPFKHVETASIKLEKGEILLLYTDGVVEAHNKDEQLFGEKRLEKAFQNVLQSEAETLVETITQEVAAFAEGTPQHDDITLLALKVC